MHDLTPDQLAAALHLVAITLANADDAKVLAMPRLQVSNLLHLAAFALEDAEEGV